jgi:hypothetical protein
MALTAHWQSSWGTRLTNSSRKGTGNGVLPKEDPNPQGEIVARVKGGQIGNGSRVEACLQRADEQPCPNELATAVDPALAEGHKAPAELCTALVCQKPEATRFPGRVQKCSM